MAETEELADTVVLTVNGRERGVPAGSTIADLLQGLGIDPRMVVVEYNREILHDRGLHANNVLAAGDTVEIVHFVGGG
jgi:sulfur carrier protein